MITLTTRTDAHGNPISGPQDAVDRYDTAVDHLLAYRTEVLDAMTSLATDEPDFAMGQILAAYLSLTSTDAPDLAGARQIAANLDTLALNERESAHRATIETWLAGDWHGAAQRLDALLVRWPADLLGLLVGHQLDFFLGDAANLRDRVARSLPAIDPVHPHAGYVHGMFAFGLEESGHYQLAEHHGLAALDRNRGDVWATHAVTHVYEMQGRIDEGIRFLRRTQADWTQGNLFTVHNWWHLALYLLEAGRNGEALDVYDRHVHNDGLGGRSARDARRQRPAVAAVPRRRRRGRPLRAARRSVGDPHRARAVVRVQRPARRHGVGGRRPVRRRTRRDRPARHLRGHRGAVLERAHDRRGRPARLPVGARLRRGSPRRRRRRAAAGPQDPRPLRRLARPARRAPAHTRRVGDPCQRGSTSPGRSSTSDSVCARRACGRGATSSPTSPPRPWSSDHDHQPLDHRAHPDPGQRSPASLRHPPPQPPLPRLRPRLARLVVLLSTAFSRPDAHRHGVRDSPARLRRIRRPDCGYTIDDFAADVATSSTAST